MNRQQVYKKFNINPEKQKFLDKVPIEKIIYYESQKHKKVEGYFDEIFPPEGEFCFESFKYNKRDNDPSKKYKKKD